MEEEAALLNRAPGSCKGYGESCGKEESCCTWLRHPMMRASSWGYRGACVSASLANGDHLSCGGGSCYTLSMWRMRKYYGKDISQVQHVGHIVVHWKKGLFYGGSSFEKNCVRNWFARRGVTATEVKKADMR